MSHRKVNKASFLEGFVWKLVEQYSVLGIQFVLQIVLARILAPSVFGELTIVLIFIAITNVFVQSGFPIALIQMKDIDRNDENTAFFISLIIAVIAYFLIYLLAPSFGVFFHSYNLSVYLRVCAIILFPGVYTSIVTALAKRNVDFKTIFHSSFVSVLVSGILSVILALSGWGIWTLIFQQIIYSVVNALYLFMRFRWIPSFSLNHNSVKYLYKIGFSVLMVNLINELSVQLRNIVIGRSYTKSDLAFYSRGQQFPNLLTRSINGALSEIVLVKTSKIQDNFVAVLNSLKKTVALSSFIIFPVLILMTILSPVFVPLLLTEKWNSSIPYVMIFCAYYSTWPISSTMNKTLYGIGKTKIVLYLEVIWKILDVIVLIITLHYGPLYIALGLAIVSAIATILYSIITIHNLNGEYQVVFYSFLRPLFSSLIMSIPLVYLVDILPDNFINLIIEFIVGMLLYVIASYIFNKKDFLSFCSIISGFIKSKRQI